MNSLSENQRNATLSVLLFNVYRTILLSEISLVRQTELSLLDFGFRV